MKLVASANYAGMFTYFALILFCLSKVCLGSSIHIPLPFSSFKLFGHHKEVVKAAPSQYENFFDQNTDQFDSPNKTHYQNFIKTFKQRYFVNYQWKSTNNIDAHILWVEGEGSASDVTVTDINLPHVALAKEVGATVWTLEHRFRGKSQIFKRTFHNNYADYLSSVQAVEDIMNFIKSMNTASKERNPKWVVVGRNYGATLALWFRQKYPQFSVGVIADSPAVVPAANFYNYQKFIEKSYSNYSYNCWHGTKFSALAIRNELQYTAGIDSLNDELKITPSITWKMDYKDYQHLHHNIIGLFEIPIVYSKVNIGPFSTSCGIDDFCKFMENRKDRDIQRVYNWANHLYSITHGGKKDWPGIDNSYSKMIKWLNSTRHDLDDTEQPSARSWLFQQCHEFGQFVTTDSGHGLFWSTVPNDYWIGVCTDVFEEKIFNYSINNLIAGINNLKQNFDTSQLYKGSNAIMFYGGSDPWQLLGVNSVADHSSIVHTVLGVGHAPVLMPVAVTDSSELTYARNSVMIPTVKKWLKAQNNKIAAQESVRRNVADKSETHISLPSIVFQELKRPVSSISYFQNQSVHVNFHPTFPSKKETIRRSFFRFKGGSIHQQIDKYLRNKMKNVQFYNSLTQKQGVVPKKNNLRAGYVNQDVDHFDSASKFVFKQRFFKNDLFQEDKDAVRFLMIGGESALNAYYVEDDYLQYYRWAKDFRAVMYALEHRFYGYSNPFENCSTELLVKYLNTEQVLADIAVFVDTMNQAEGNTNPRWIVFGGSYAGSLVAAFRLRYPSLSLGGIASSAPLQAKTDFYEYTQRVEKDIHKYGGKRCPSAVRRYFAFLRKWMNVRRGRVGLKQIFCIDNRWDENYIDENDARFFPIEQMFILEGAVQYDSENQYGIQNMCYYYYHFDGYFGANVQKKNTQIAGRKKRFADAFLRSIHPMSKMRSGLKKSAPTNQPYYQYPDDNEDNYHDYDDSQPSRVDDPDAGSVDVVCPSNCNSCERVSYNQYLENLEDMNRHCYMDGTYCTDESRLWLWLQCSQWGYMQSTNYGYNIFGSSLPINFYLNLCTDVFGSQYNRTLIDQIVARTNAAYGGQNNYNGTNVMFVNGSEDPWSTLSVYKPLQPQKNVTSLLVTGVSHCADMKREDVHDAQELKDARKAIKKQLVRWVRRPKSPHTPKDN